MSQATAPQQPAPPPRSFPSAVIDFLLGSDSKYRDRSILAIVRLFLISGLFYSIFAGLFLYWPQWNKSFQAYFRTFGDAAFQQFLVWPHASARFLDMNSRTIVEDIRAAVPDPLDKPFPLPPRDKIKDTLVVLRNGALVPPELGLLRTGSRIIAYWSIAAVCAIALATPWPWKRRLWLLLWCLLLVHAFILIRLSIFALKGSFAVKSKRIHLVEISDAWFERLERLDAVMNDNPTTNFIAPIVLWIGVVVSMELWVVVKNKLSSLARTRGDRRDPAARMDRGGRRTRR